MSEYEPPKTIGEVEVGGPPAMTVADLIAKLRGLPPDLAVYVESDDWTEEGSSGVTWPARDIVRRGGFTVELLTSDSTTWEKKVQETHQVPDRVVLR